MDNAQMIITVWGDGLACSVASPQLPGIVAAYDGHPDAIELFKLAVSAGLSPDGDIDVHIQRAVEVEDKQFFIRCRHDHRNDDRGRVASRIEQEVLQDAGLRQYADADKYDEALIVATLPTDRLRSIMDGVDSGQPFTIGAIREDAVIYIGLLSSSGKGRRLSDLGLDDSSTVGTLFDRLSEDPAHQHDKVLVSAW